MSEPNAYGPLPRAPLGAPAAKLALGLLVLAVVAGLSGCLGSEGAAGTASSPGERAVPADADGSNQDSQAPLSGAPASFEFRSCNEQGGIFPVPKEEYRDALPEGFSMVSPDPAGEFGVLVTPHLVCELPDGSHHSEAWIFLAVDPPDGWENPDADFGHVVALQGVIGSRAGYETYSAWGFGDAISHGEVRLEVTDAPGGRMGATSSSSGDAYSDLRTTVQGEAETLEGHTGRVFALGADGEVAGAKDVTWTSHQGVEHGEAVLDASPPEAGIPVPDREGIAFHLWGDDYDFTETPVDLPPR